MSEIDDFDRVILSEVRNGATLQEIAHATLKAVSTVQSRLIRLEREGYISSDPGKHRSRHLTTKGEQYVPKDRRPSSEASAGPADRDAEILIHRANRPSR